MKHWFKDQHFRSLLKNSSYLAMSRGVAAVCSLATLAFAGRGLGVMLFGTLILITSYARAASGIAKFQSWQLIVRYGGQGLAAGNPEQFKSSTGFAAALDVVSGLIGMLLAVMLLPLVAGWVGIERQYWWLAMLYCTLLPTMGAASPNGVLRALDRFDLISWSGTLTPISRAILAGIAFAQRCAARRLCRDLVRHRPRRRPVPMVPRLARAAAARPSCRHPPDAEADHASRRVEVRHPDQPRGRGPDGLGTDRPARGRRPARPRRRGLVPHRLEPRRQRAETRRLARQGLLSRDRAHGPHARRSRGS